MRKRYRLVFLLTVFICTLAACGREAPQPPAPAAATAAAGLSLADLPEVPGAEPPRQWSPDPEHLTAEYRILLPADTPRPQLLQQGIRAASAFGGRMETAGWRRVQETRQSVGKEFLFRRDIVREVRARVAATTLPLQGIMRPCVILYLEYRRRLPLRDVPGHDPVDVPRYPGSVRVRWMHLLGDFAAKYAVAADPAAVRKYLEREVPKQGWKPGPGAGDLNYLRDMPETQAETGRRGIPTTLSISLAEDDGVVMVGVGRTAGAADRGRGKVQLETPLTPALPPEPATPAAPSPATKGFSLPLFPGLKSTSRRDLAVNHRGEDRVRFRYAMDNAPMADALAMADFFTRELTYRGWNLEKQEWFGIGRTLAFRRDSRQLEVRIQAVGRYPIPQNAPNIRIPVQADLIFDVPRREAPGEDIPGVPRYPGSVRFRTLKAGRDHIVKFKALARPGEVESFFIRRLPLAGWSFSGYDATGMLFVPADTPGSAGAALAKGRLIPTTLKIKVDRFRGPAVMIGMDLTRGDRQ